MSWIRKLLIIIIFILFSFILFRLGVERRAIKTKYAIEGFASSSEAAAAQAELAAIKAAVYNVPASTIDTTNAKLPLAQYCIKGAYNTALTGQYINVEMIKFLFSRGCRFLDFEVFSFEGVPYVAMSTDSTFATINTANKDTLQNVLTTVVTYGFSAPSQITIDPVFVHLRIKTNQASLYDTIAKLIGDIVADRRLADSNSVAIPVNGSTLLSTLQGKIVIVLEKRNLQPDYTTSKLGNYVNMMSNSDVMEEWSYGNLVQEQRTSPRVMDDNISTSVTKLRLVTPDMGASMWSDLTGITNKPVYYPMVMNYGVQVLMYPFYRSDLTFYLAQYEKAFSAGKAAFVPMSQMMSVIQNALNAGMPPAAAAAPTSTIQPAGGQLQSIFGKPNTGDATTFIGAGTTKDIMAQGRNVFDRAAKLQLTQSGFL